MPSAIIPIATFTTVSAVNTVVFSSIPGTYRDLMLVVRGSLSSSGSIISIRSGSTNIVKHSVISMLGVSTPSTHKNEAPQMYSQVTVSPVEFALETHIYDYAQTNKNKAITSQDMGGTSYAALTVGFWDSTTAMTSLTVLSYGGSTLAAGTNISLYGVTA